MLRMWLCVRVCATHERRRYANKDTLNYEMELMAHVLISLCDVRCSLFAEGCVAMYYVCACVICHSPKVDMRASCATRGVRCCVYALLQYDESCI